MRQTLRPPMLPPTIADDIASVASPIETTSSEIQKSAKRRLHHAMDGTVLRVEGPKHDGWWIAKIVIRSFSTATAVAIIILTIILYSFPLTTQDIVANIAGYSWAGAVLLWDTCEFITICCRRGYGVTPKAHIGLELTLFLLGVAAMATMCVFDSRLWYPYTCRGYGIYCARVAAYPALLALLVLLLTMHFILLVRNCMDRRRGRGITPRIMYLPTGQPVVVLPRPYPPAPTRETDLEMDVITTNEPTPVSPVDPSSPHIDPLPRQQLPPPLPPRRVHTDASSSTAAGSSDPGTRAGSTSQQQQQQQSEKPPRRRKPVPTRGTHYAEPWAAPGPGYAPDEAERRRAERGEGQAQWMSLGEVGVRGRPGGDTKAGEGSHVSRRWSG